MYRNRSRRGKGKFTVSRHNCQPLINEDLDENGRVFIRFLFHVLLHSHGTAAYLTSNFTYKLQLSLRISIGERSKCQLHVSMLILRI